MECFSGIKCNIGLALMVENHGPAFCSRETKMTGIGALAAGSALGEVYISKR